MKDMPIELKEVLPLKYHYKNLIACDVDSLHEAMGAIIDIEGSATGILTECKLAEAHILEALYRKGAKKSNKLTILMEDRV